MRVTARTYPITRKARPTQGPGRPGSPAVRARGGRQIMTNRLLLQLLIVVLGGARASGPASAQAASQQHSDGRPEATLRSDARDHGIVLRYGDGPDDCDVLGARDVWVFEDQGTYYMHYDAAGPRGWLTSLAVSKDLLTWNKRGPILDFGDPGEEDSGSAAYGVTYHDGRQWHLGTVSRTVEE